MSIASDIILERLKTHPEEFVHVDGDITHGTWSPLINNMPRWATPEEIKAIEEGIVEARRTLANEIAMKILSGEYYMTEPLEKSNLFYQHPYNTQTQVEQTQMKRMMDIQREYAKLQSAGGIVK